MFLFPVGDLHGNLDDLFLIFYKVSGQPVIYHFDFLLLRICICLIVFVTVRTVNVCAPTTHINPRTTWMVPLS